MIRSGASSAQRTARSLAFALGIGSGIYGLAGGLEVAGQATVAAAWWTVFAVVTVFGSAVLLAAVAFVLPMYRVRSVAAAMAGGVLASAALVPWAMDFGALSGETLWVYRVTNLGAVAAVLAWPDYVALVYLPTSVAVATVANAHAAGKVATAALVEDFALTLALSAVFAICCWSALRTATTLDRETSAAETKATEVAVAEARERERSRFAALTHDGVMSTLLEASRERDPRGRDSRVLARQAQRTLTQLDEFRSGGAAAATVELNTLLDFLRTAVQGADVAVSFTVQREPDAARLRMPVDMASTMAAALTEAVHNSLRHAGSGRVQRQVIVTVGPHDIRVALIDDGVGFDPERVPTHRLGVAVSILGRMRQVPGGSASVESKPGVGTRVTLSWNDRAPGA